MACGCSDDSCTCVVQGELDVAVSGSGTVGDPYIVSHDETEFAAIEGDGIEITPGGAHGHEPEIEIKLDPSSTADVSVSEDGLKVDLPTDDSIPVLAFYPGMMMDFGGDVAPPGWFMQDGSLKDATIYSDLYAEIGHKYNGGVDPGGGMFRLPDARGRASYGPKLADTLGTMDGVAGAESALGKTHTHTGPAHTHTTPAHTHDYTPSGTNSANTTNSATDNGNGNSHHLGHILRDTGANSLCTDADLTFGDTEVAPSLSGCASIGGGDSFTKLVHSHVVAGQAFLGTAANTGTGTSGGNTGSAGTGNTGSAELPHLIVNKIIKY